MLQYCDYPAIIDHAMRMVIKNILQQVEKDGVLNEHYFLINFKTDFPGVSISSKLKSQYKKEMMIVLQHQFTNLIIEDESFSVELIFNKTKESLTIPFNAITEFNDPSVHFVLQLDNNYFDLADHEVISKTEKKSAKKQSGIKKEGNIIDITEMLKNK